MFYYIIRAIIRILYRIIYRVRIEGLDNIPDTGPIIICGNHIHFIDPVIVIASIKRPIYYLAKKELFDSKLKNWVFRKMNVISLNREANDMEAYRAAMGVLNKGDALGIFAQGSRMKDIDVKSAKSGVTMFALKGNALVVPAFFDATYKPFTKVLLRYGKPIDLSEYKDVKIKSDLLSEITENIMREIALLGGPVSAEKQPATAVAEKE